MKSTFIRLKHINLDGKQEEVYIRAVGNNDVPQELIDEIKDKITGSNSPEDIDSKINIAYEILESADYTCWDDDPCDFEIIV